MPGRGDDGGGLENFESGRRGEGGNGKTRSVGAVRSLTTQAQPPAQRRSGLRFGAGSVIRRPGLIDLSRSVAYLPSDGTHLPVGQTQRPTRRKLFVFPHPLQLFSGPSGSTRPAIHHCCPLSPPSSICSLTRSFEPGSSHGARRDRGAPPQQDRPHHGRHRIHSET